VAVCEERARTDLTRVFDVRSLTTASSRSLAALALAVAAGAVLAVRLDAPAFFDNEGRYAEVAREMLVRRDWITPHLDFTLFLNKPPLTFWLTAAVFQWTGPSEWARLVSVAAAVVALYATCRLGALLHDERGGLVAAVMLATTLGFVLEARTLRPDMLLTATVVAALCCWRRAETTSEGRARWLAGMYAALGIGVLAKGLVPLVIVGLPIVTITLREHGWPGVRALRPGLGLVVLAAVVLPWHVAVALRHPGFAWDYVVNQHLLFFLDRKFPRDSEGDTLGFFWGAFAGRALPWILFLPLTLGEAVRGAARDAAPAERATFLLWAWIGGTVLFFSLAPSRLEHYSIPALPAVALLAARGWQRASAGELGRASWRMVVLAGAAIACVGGVGLAYGPALLLRTYWIAQVPELLGLVRPAAVVVLLVGVLAALASVRRRAGLLVASLAIGMVPLVAIVLRAEVAAEPLFSWRPVARALAASVSPETEIVFEAPEEYQLVGGLVFYTGRRITLLEPPAGFIPPTYLAGQMQGMFLARHDFERRWPAGERLAFVSDSQRRRDDPHGIVPDPFHVFGRFGDRWVLSNVSGAR
jgi:4-amino-4-deoxy-L-arabinose transferase-like glycosyltransferase